MLCYTYKYRKRTRYKMNLNFDKETILKIERLKALIEAIQIESEEEEEVE